MSTSEQIPFHIEINQIIDLLARQIYQSPLALLRENLQNAYDAILQRKYEYSFFEPKIEITLTPTEVRVIDNGIGMTKKEMVDHYWKAGSSGKNNPEARAAGVVGTFGIGAMANFGVASELTVITESIRDNQRTKGHAIRETLSATKECIQLSAEVPRGQPGTTIIAKISPDTPVDVNAASTYVKDFTKHLDIPVTLNGVLISEEGFETSVPKPPVEVEYTETNVAFGQQFKADVKIAISNNGEVWLYLDNIWFTGEKIDGSILLRQGMQQVRTFRSKFALATAPISSLYNFGGVANLSVLEPTAGREAITTPSIQFLQSIVVELEGYVSEKLATTKLADSNTNFMQWVVQHGRFELCDNLKIRCEPDDRSIPLVEVKELSKVNPVNYFEGSDPALIEQYASDDKPLLVLATRQPRRKCEVSYLKSYCNVQLVSDIPTVLRRKSESDWTIAESAFAFRLINVIQSDYFVEAIVQFGKISHDLPLFVDTSEKPTKIILDSESPNIAMMLRMYTEEFSAYTGFVKDFARTMIFPKIADLVPSSTKQGAKAFLRAIRRPLDLYEYEKSDIRNLTEIWEDYLEGKIALSDAAEKSTNIVRTSVQVFDSTATATAIEVIPDVLENERILKQQEEPDISEGFAPSPAITRFEIETPAKLLVIDDSEPPLKGYRCFIAVTDRLREERGEFFLQPHYTEIVWGGQKALYIFQHHSRQFGLYYELQSNDLLTDTPGGRAFTTCTLVIKNRTYIPIPDNIRRKFIPEHTEKKRFEIRYDLLYPRGGIDAGDYKT